MSTFFPLSATHVAQTDVHGQSCMESLPRVDLGSLVPLPALSTHCGRGSGLAVRPALGLLVT
jgi:hypothetical protein